MAVRITPHMRNPQERTAKGRPYRDCAAPPNPRKGEIHFEPI